jgi:hypothetical protein
MLKGNQPTDGGNFILSPTQRRELLRTSPEAAAFVRKLYGSKEMIDGIDRYCIWIEDDQASLARKIAQISRRLDGVTLARLQSTAESTRERADHAHRFIQMQDYGKRATAVPEISSEKSEYIPCGVISADSIATNKLFTIDEADIYVLALCSSRPTEFGRRRSAESWRSFKGSRHRRHPAGARGAFPGDHRRSL